MNEIRGQFNDVLVISELRGAYPNVPIAADVDYAALIAGDLDPVFVTLPIGKANVTSGNNRHYDDAFVTELLRQTLALKPIGLTGHLTEAERATAFPQESLHWVGAMRDGDLAWGKAYVLGEARDRLRRYKASGKQIATSIDADCDGVWDESLKAFRMDAKTLKLGQIDLAPADRAGIGDLARVPMLTTEMETEPIDPPQEVIVDKLEILNGLTAEDARLLPKAVRDAILAEQAAPPEVAEVQEMRKALGVDDKADLARVVTEMKQAQETQAKAAVQSRITELVSDKDKGIKVESVRGIVTELVKARNPRTVQEAEQAYSDVAASTHVTELLKAQVQTVMGPPQRTPLQTQNGAAKYFPIPAEKQEA